MRLYEVETLCIPLFNREKIASITVQPPFIFAPHRCDDTGTAIMNQILPDMNLASEAHGAVLPDLIKKKTITVSDVAALRNADLAIGLVSRPQAEQMFAIERGPARKCRAWGDLLVETLLDFAVWGQRPTGHVTDENARWLLSQAGEKPSAASLALLIAVLEEAGSVPSWYGAAVRARAQRMFDDGPLDKAA